jgi:hypothetical protein
MLTVLQMHLRVSAEIPQRRAESAVGNRRTYRIHQEIRVFLRAEGLPQLGLDEAFERDAGGALGNPAENVGVGASVAKVAGVARVGS